MCQDIYEEPSISDDEMYKREEVREARLSIEVKQWVKIGNEPIYPFRKPGKCWHGYDVIESHVQSELDRICTIRNGGVTACAVCSNHGYIRCYCNDMFQMDYTDQGPSCITNCGKLGKCYGSSNLTKKFGDIKSYILNSLITHNCVVSHVQKSVDKLCGKGKVIRAKGNDLACYESQTINLLKEGVCFDECGIPIRCHGQGVGEPKQIINPMTIDWDKYVKNCICAEQLTSWDRTFYVGCLARTITGKTCKSWSELDGVTFPATMRSIFIRNYCRKLDVDGIQCYNMENVLEDCPSTDKVADIHLGGTVDEEVGLFLQPGAYFDIWIKPYIPNYEIVVRFFEVDSICGEKEIPLPPISQPFEYQPYDVHTGTWSIVATKEMRNPYPSLDDNMESVYVVKGFKVLPNANKKVRVCACAHSRIFQRPFVTTSCDKSNEYIIDLGTFIISGPAVPDKPNVHVSAMDAVVNCHTPNVAVISMIHIDQVTAALNIRGGNIYMMSVDTLFNIEGSYRYTMNTTYSVDAERPQHPNGVIPRCTVHSTKSLDVINVSKPGMYVTLCNETNPDLSIKHGMTPRRIIGWHNFHGYEENMEFTLFENESRTLGTLTQSLFIKSWTAPSQPAAIVLSNINKDSPCTAPFGYSSTVLPTDTANIESGPCLWRVESIHVNKLKWENTSTFDVCAYFDNGSTKRLGIGKKTSYIEHELTHLVSYINEIPNNISTHVVQDEWDLFLTHGNKDSDNPFDLTSVYPNLREWEYEVVVKYIDKYNCNCSPKHSEDEQYYPQVLSFWCLKESNLILIFGMIPNSVTPTFIGQLAVERPIAFEIIVSYQSITALVLSEGKNTIEHYEVSVTLARYDSLRFVLKPRPLKCGEKQCLTFMATTDMKVIHYSMECRKRYMVIVTDAGANCIILLNSELAETDRMCQTPDGLTSHIREPGRIACTRVTKGSCNSYNVTLYQQETVNCFVTQKRSGILLWIQVNLKEERMTLEDVYTGELVNPGESEEQRRATTVMPLLTYPDTVETVSYNFTDFVYLIENESSVIRTFLINQRDENRQLLYYGDFKLPNAQHSSYLGIKGIQMSKDEENAAVEDDYLLLFRRPESLGIGRQMGGYVTLMNIKETIRVSDFDYVIPNWIIVGEDQYVEPQIKGSTSHFNGLTRYDLDVISDPWHGNHVSSKCIEMGPQPRVPLDGLGPAQEPLELRGYTAISNSITVSQNGMLTINVRSVNRITLRLRITAVGPIDSKCIYKTLSLACPDGHYFHNDKDHKQRGCKVCPIGYYNSIISIENDLTKWGECTKCPENESTIDVGATSPSQCICAPGFYLVEGQIPRCQPCPRGTWKGVVGSQECTGGGCYKNSDSDVIGSKTEEERRCACRSGYFYRHLAGYPKECISCEEGYFCPGGFHGKKIPCPINMTTHISSDSIDAKVPNPPASKVNDCVCKPGFQPAEYEKINKSGSEEYQLRRQIVKELNVYDIKDYDIYRLVCIPCPHNTYKELKGDSKCIPCPVKTFRDPTSLVDAITCNRCAPGYFETNDPSNPCEECPPNHICVGSDPLDPDLLIYKGKKVMCHKHAITIPPYEKNTNMSHCICNKGFTNSKEVSAICEHVPKSTYKDVIGNVAPKNCPEGAYTPKPGATKRSECVCNKGMYFDEANKRCTICPVGKYCSGGRDTKQNHTQPKDCTDKNSITKELGASSSSECLCKPGFYMRQDGYSGCIECPENTYKSHVSNESCTECDEHSSTNGGIGATSKEQCVCAPGYYFDGTCKACGYPDKYCPGGSIVSRDEVTGEMRYETKPPVDCPPNTEIPPGVDTADSVDSCKCGKGYGLAKTTDVNKVKQCVPCAPGSYKSTVIDSSCNSLCTMNATSKPGAHSPFQCYCQPGYYHLEDGYCVPCVEGARCDGGVVGKDSSLDPDEDGMIRRTHVNPVPIEGYYLDKINQELRKPDDWRFIMCPIKGACLGEKGCSESMTAYLCAECKTGYTNNFKKGTLCSKCPSTMTNLILTIAWYLGLLLVNIVMACLNVSAGYNRRSIHSVVIKIALNYGVCMSVLNVINFGEVELPHELKSTTLNWIRMLYRESRTFYTSIDCLLQDWFGMNHAVSFFYTMLYIACLPVILLVVVTILMWVILELFKIKRHHLTRSKLALLYQSSVQGMHYLADRLRDEYANERLFLIFRYIPLPGETRWVRFKHFLEDMIPIYVTVLFSVHGNTTSHMLSLLDCTCIHLGQSIPSKYVLRPAMSIKCSLDPNSGYYPYLLLGLGGLVFWGFGIPFFSYIVLLINRRNLYAPDVRMKYGFLHNGYQQDYWFWEAIVFTRKSLVLVIGSIVIVPSENTSASRIWMALAVAVLFLIIQLIYKPFDERDYFVLGRLESHSMISWTMTLIFCLFAVEGEISAYNNMYLLSITTIINFCFIAEVVLELGLAYCDNIRFRKDNCNTSIISRINRSLASISEKRKLREPLIIFNEMNRTIDLRAPKTAQWYSFDDSNRRLKYSEKVYFTHIVTEVINFANIHMKLDIIPTDFPEFISRLALAVNFHELNKKKADDIVRSLADGNLDEIVNLAMFESREPRMQMQNLLSFASSVNGDEGEFVVPPVLLFDKEVINNGIPLSDFYMALSIIKMKDIYSVVKSYQAFRVLRVNADREMVLEQYEKIHQMEDLIRRIQDPDNKSLEEIFCSDEDIVLEKQAIEELEDKLEKLKRNPLGALEEFGEDVFEEQIERIGFRRTAVKRTDPS
ncbi:kringle domain-containing protein [Babesia ovis]|uniref:Kringle domain-containing protein n=1 Tax=Babesia ovis TaxID=5869 RepID=A0A9W5TC44_BABOV|nr:kringle domain-containing protein [Babesia ovis]